MAHSAQGELNRGTGETETRRQGEKETRNAKRMAHSARSDGQAFETGNPGEGDTGTGKGGTMGHGTQRENTKHKAHSVKDYFG